MKCHTPYKIKWYKVMVHAKGQEKQTLPPPKKAKTVT